MHSIGLNASRTALSWNGVQCKSIQVNTLSVFYILRHYLSFRPNILETMDINKKPILSIHQQSTELLISNSDSARSHQHVVTFRQLKHPVLLASQYSSIQSPSALHAWPSFCFLSLPGYIWKRKTSPFIQPSHRGYKPAQMYVGAKPG